MVIFSVDNGYVVCAAGELRVQAQLLLRGVESAPLTTDAGVDLVAFSAERNDAITVQVKSNLRAKPGGGKGKPHLDWWAPDDSIAELFAFVDLESSRVWLIKNEELGTVAQQHSSGRFSSVRHGRQEWRRRHK